IGNLRDRWYLPHCSENEFVECKAEEAVEVRANSSVLDVVCIPSIRRCTVGHMGSSRRESGPTHRFDPSGTHTHWLPAIREWHSVSGTLDRVFESLRSQPSHQVGCTSTIELLLESEPLAISQSEDRTAVHEGEVFAGVQSVLFPGTASRPTVSVRYIRRVHVSVAPELDIGSF